MCTVRKMNGSTEGRKMDEFDKVEKLRQRANVSFEEARDALRACDGDLLDAMVYLERLGHVKAPEKAVFSTNADEKYENVPDVIVKNEKSADPSFGEQLGHLLKTAFRKSIDNSLGILQGTGEIPLAGPGCDHSRSDDELRCRGCHCDLTFLRCKIQL